MFLFCCYLSINNIQDSFTMRKILIILLLLGSLQLFAKKDSLIIHKDLIGVGINSSPLIYLLDPFYYLDFGIVAGFYYQKTINNIDLRFELFFGKYDATWYYWETKNMIGGSYGIGSRAFRKKKLQFVYAIDVIVQYKYGDYYIDYSATTIIFALAPVIGLRYKVLNQLYLSHEISIAPSYYYTKYRLTGGPWFGYPGFMVDIHKLLSFQILYGF